MRCALLALLPFVMFQDAPDPQENGKDDEPPEESHVVAKGSLVPTYKLEGAFAPAGAAEIRRCR